MDALIQYFDTRLARLLTGISSFVQRHAGALVRYLLGQIENLITRLEASLGIQEPIAA